jgi:hypothetical protein
LIEYLIISLIHYLSSAVAAAGKQLLNEHSRYQVFRLFRVLGGDENSAESIQYDSFDSI